MRAGYQTKPVFLSLCRKLLHDKEAGVRLEAAVWVGQSALSSDPREPGLFPILIAGLESKEQRRACAELYTYVFGPVRPVGTGRASLLPRWPGGQFSAEDLMQEEIERALARLERYLTPDQKDCLRRAKQTASE